YGGPEFLFSKTGVFPRYIDSHVRPLTLVQKKLGLRVLSHHKVGRHSVASQAVTGGESVKAVQAQLGHRSEQSTHKYVHLGAGAQKRLVEVGRGRAIRVAGTPERTEVVERVRELIELGGRNGYRRADLVALLESFPT
ncbi:MAG: hypothetical protein ACRDZX_18685, partial [Acidimicrobiales bacterium]